MKKASEVTILAYDIDEWVLHVMATAAGGDVA
jgi:hypothetical protein